MVLGRLIELKEDVLDVFAHVAGFSQRGSVGDGEGHVEHPRKRLGEEGFAGTRRADEQDVALLQFDAVWLGVVDPLVVVVNRNRERRLAGSWPTTY